MLCNPDNIPKYIGVDLDMTVVVITFNFMFVFITTALLSLF